MTAAADGDALSAGSELIRHRVPARMSWAVSAIIGFRETAARPSRMVESAVLDVPLVLGFGAPFWIGLGQPARDNERFVSFTAGLFTGPAVIDSPGGTECVQVNFTPLGARRFFDVQVAEMTERTIASDDILGPQGSRLREQLANTAGWGDRFVIMERFIDARLQQGERVAREVAAAYGKIVESGGRTPILEVARDIGWSRKHLAQRFRQDVGLTPKSVARIARFRRALTHRAAQERPCWADIAYACGYADQSHLQREFRLLTGSFAAER